MTSNKNSCWWHQSTVICLAKQPFRWLCLKQKIAANCEKYIRAMDPFPWPSEFKFFAFILLYFKFSRCQLIMLGPANSNSDQPITTIFAYDTWHTSRVKAYDKFVLKTRKWNVTKWNFHHLGMKIIPWTGPQDIKATKSEGSRPIVERQNCKPCNRYSFFSQGYP